MEEKEIIKQITKGKIFIYPTDTIYGLGCDATNIRSVNKIKEIKQRDLNRPLSVIAPSAQWIKENFVVDVDLEKYLPGPYTMILKKKNPNFLFHVSSTDLLGVRIPNHEFTNIIQKAGLPFITTSVNLSGEPFIKEISEVSHDILEHIDHIIDYGPLIGNPSVLIKDGKEVKRE
ncbi:MAG: L-threonylcarbamoyladenylate synthase [Candidatus Pacearchaeota archaeon]|jgi:L-threonylcarbamoyladenylate synthase